MSIAAVVLAATNIAAPEVSHFPGSYFEATAKASLQRRAMEKWPGSAQMIIRWQTGELKQREKIAILLGTAATHDPILLPLYREAITSASGRMRMAAAYGYRILLADSVPDVTNGVDPAAAARLAEEMDLVALTLRERPLVEFWLQAALMSEGASMPGWQGLVFRRPPSTCLRAVEQILSFDDFSYLATAYRQAKQKSTRVSLMRLLEAITLKEFLAKPRDTRTGWGARDIDAALAATDAFIDSWVDGRCSTDPNAILSSSLNTMGVRIDRPLGPESYDVWLQVLKKGAAPWRMMAARQLYNFGGKWSQLSVFRAEAPSQIEARNSLVRWYRLLPAHILNRGKPKAQSQP